MKHLTNYKLFESNNFPTDRNEIRKICKKYGIEDYKVNFDGSVDVDGPVDLKRQIEGYEWV